MPTKQDFKILEDANVQGRAECSPEFLKEFDETSEKFASLTYSNKKATYSNKRAWVRIIPKNFSRRESPFLKELTKKETSRGFSPRGLFVSDASMWHSLLIVRRQDSETHMLWTLAHEFGHFAHAESANISLGTLSFSIPDGTDWFEAKADKVGCELVMRSDLSKERKEKILRAAWQIRKEINSRKEKRNDII